MKTSRPIFITTANQISIQQPLCDEWIDNPIEYDGNYHEAIDPQFKEWLSAGEARRLGKIMKRAVATSAVTMQQSSVACPNAIITATGLGCVKNTELFLTDMCTNGEQLLKPTQFMQSTHNTIGSLIAILNKCHGYNVTYANGDISTEIALLDAVTQLELGDIKTALVGAHDEMTPCYYTLLERIGYYGADGMVTSGETAVSFMISDEKNENTLCRLTDIAVYHKPDEKTIAKAMANVQPVSCILAGFNGKPADDNRYTAMINRFFPGVTVLRYKNLFGESMTSSALGIYAAASILEKRRYPTSMYVSGATGSEINDILCLNISGNNLAIVRLTANTDTK